MASTLKVNTIQHTGGTSAMTIDSSGRILTPARPYFQVTKTTSQETTAGTSAAAPIIQFDQVNNNIGSCWNTSNHQFVAPLDGVYQFNFGLLLSNIADGDDSLHVFIAINGAVKQFFLRSPGEAANNGPGYGGFLHCQGSAAYYLTSNQTVDLRFRGDTDPISIHGSDVHCNFNGYLVG